MNAIRLHDRAALETFLRRDAALHLYALGDLDDFFWSFTTWHGLEENGALVAVTLLYGASDPPTLLALSGAPFEPMRELLRRIELPRRLYAHVTPACLAPLADRFHVASNGPHLKMAWRDPARLLGIDTSATVALGETDCDEVQAFYDTSHPGNWFEPRMLATGCYRGLREQGQLACVAGVHVYSPRLRVAALGNIATRPESRGRGLATTVTASVCAALQPIVDLIGLNVKADNVSALACYRRLGFEPVAAYEECVLTAR